MDLSICIYIYIFIIHIKGYMYIYIHIIYIFEEKAPFFQPFFFQRFDLQTVHQLRPSGRCLWFEDRWAEHTASLKRCRWLAFLKGREGSDFPRNGNEKTCSPCIEWLEQKSFCWVGWWGFCWVESFEVRKVMIFLGLKAMIFVGHCHIYCTCHTWCYV